jgi:hypothetical protein
MPNYCKGQLKIRGKYEDIQRFVENEIRTYDYNVPGKPVLNLSKRDIDEEDGDYCLDLLHGCAYIETTHRNFVDDGTYCCSRDENRKDGTSVLVVNLFTAWDIDPEPYAAFSKKYNLDFRVYAFERGMQFNRDIVVMNGHVIKNEKIKFEDYDWECIAPRVGG